MLFDSNNEGEVAHTMSRLACCNPFLRERIELERAALGDRFVNVDTVWNVAEDWEGNRPNIGRLQEKAEDLLARARQRLIDGHRPSAKELLHYEGLVIYVLYYRVHEPLKSYIKGTMQQPRQEIAALYQQFARDFEHLIESHGVTMPSGYDAPHLFACFFQVRRAFHHIFRHIVGASMPAGRLRAAVWQSIFTHDIHRYRRLMYDRMRDLTTLITGPSGTGKELVARAIAMSQYIPFNARTRTFASDSEEMFHPLNLSALSPTLIESELFGHRRGAFTGALEDRQGWLEVCQPLGTVFLDEVGELDPAIQVKLLRVLQSRTFQKLGDTKPRMFRGKIVAATNLDLAQEMSQGRFRRDFYYRICSDMIATPSLREQLAQSPQDLTSMINFIARQLVGDETEALTSEVERWIREHLGDDYPWPGNFRELEQCVRNILIRHEYRPPAISTLDDAGDLLANELSNGSMTADQLLRRYCTCVYLQTRNLQETARRLKLDRRTIKAKVDWSKVA